MPGEHHFYVTFDTGAPGVKASERLKSEHPLVQFCSAEALAYLGDASAGEVLGRMVEQQPALRAFILTALASLDEAICHVELRRLLSSSSPETRYGAFRALRALDENDDAIKGELLADKAIELPRIDYGRRNARPYRYVYAVGESERWLVFEAFGYEGDAYLGIRLSTERRSSPPTRSSASTNSTQSCAARPAAALRCSE